MPGQNDQNPSREYFKVGIALKNIHDEVLLIKEAKASTSQPDGIAETGTVSSDATRATTEHGGGKWRLPYDRLYKGDDLPGCLSSAASVIGTQLTGYDFDEHGICYVGLCEGLHEDPGIVIIYAADRPYNVSLVNPLDPEKVDAVGWFTYGYLRRLNEEGLLCDPELTLTAVKNVQQGIIVPSELITI